MYVYNLHIHRPCNGQRTMNLIKFSLHCKGANFHDNIHVHINIVIPKTFLSTFAVDYCIYCIMLKKL